jgi:hypothetical protein
MTRTSIDLRNPRTRADPAAKWKLHCAGYNGQHHPIDVLSSDSREGEDWSRYRGDKNDFNRDFIFSLQSSKWRDPRSLQQIDRPLCMAEPRITHCTEATR